MKQRSLEQFIERLDCDVYPITILKFILNKGKILSYFNKAVDPDFKVRMMYKVNYSECEQCQEKTKELGVLCRQHTSIQRVLTANRVALDLDTNVYFYKNEIFRMVGNKLVIIYCPHPKLIKGAITDLKVRKINPITVVDPTLKKLPPYKIIRQYMSSELMNEYMRCWFNHDFSIISIPNDRNKSNWCLVSNY